MKKDKMIQKTKEKRKMFLQLPYSLHQCEQSIELLINNKNIGKNNDEKNKYCLIKMVTCLELYFRNYISQLIDFGSPYRDNIEKLENINELKDFKFLNAITTKLFTIGLLIANTIKMSSLENIFSSMNKILGNDFKALLEKTEYKAIEGKNGKIINAPEKIYTDVGKIFYYRNKIVHEFVNHKDIETINNNIKNWYSSFILFIDGTEHLISDLICPESYMSQADLNIHSINKYQQIEEEMNNCIEKITKKRNELGKTLARTQELWENYSIESAKIYAEKFNGGSAYNYVFYTHLNDLARVRLEYLNETLYNIDNEMFY